MFLILVFFSIFAYMAMLIVFPTKKTQTPQKNIFRQIITIEKNSHIFKQVITDLRQS